MSEIDNPSNMVRALAIVIGPLQEIENVVQQVLSGYMLPNAVGAQLDVIGSLVKQDREGYSDDAYRRLIMARIAANRSAGTIEDVLRVTKLVFNNDSIAINLRSDGDATMVMRLNPALADITPLPILMRLLHDTIAGGARIIVEYSTLAPSLRFKFDTVDQGLDDGHFVDRLD